VGADEGQGRGSLPDGAEPRQEQIEAIPILGEIQLPPSSRSHVTTAGGHLAIT
jgi:hypothetical protein